MKVHYLSASTEHLLLLNDAMPSATKKTHQERLNLSENNSAIYLIAMTQETVCGHALLWLNHMPRYAWEPKQSGYVEGMAVMPKYQHLKIGSGLIHFIESVAVARQLTSICLSSGKEECNAYDFYRKQGFEEIDQSAHRVEWQQENAKGQLFLEHESCVGMVKFL